MKTWGLQLNHWAAVWNIGTDMVSIRRRRLLGLCSGMSTQTCCRSKWNASYNSHNKDCSLIREKPWIVINFKIDDAQSAFVGRSSFLYPLLRFCENGNASDHPIPSTKNVSVHPMPSVDAEKPKEVHTFVVFVFLVHYYILVWWSTFLCLLFFTLFLYFNFSLISLYFGTWYRGGMFSPYVFLHHHYICSHFSSNPSYWCRLWVIILGFVFNILGEFTAGTSGNFISSHAWN